MPRTPYDMPALTMLRAFEAAARREAFNEAASELNVTPGAISHQVKALERELGLTLFRRGHRSVTLTDEGRQLHDTLAQSFADISATVRRLRRDIGPDRVEIAATTAVSHLWLTPRLMDFWRDNETVQVNQQLTDGGPRRPMTTDLAIEYRTEPPPDHRFTRMFTDTLVPVCAPAFAARNPVHNLADIAAFPLIHLDTEERNWTTWTRWFEMMGHSGPINLARRVNNYSIAVQLARQGGGVALGWRALVGGHIDDGRLVALDRFSAPAPDAFFLVAASDSLSPAAESFFQWMATQVK